MIRLRYCQALLMLVNLSITLTGTPNGWASDTSGPVAPSERILRISKTPSQTALVNPLLEEARQHWAVGDWLRCEQVYLQILHKQPLHTEALQALAALAVLQQHTERAEHYYQTLLSQYPQDSHVRSGLLAISMNRWTAAEQEQQLKVILNHAPHSAQTHFLLGTIYAQTEQWASAQLAFASASQHAPEQPDYRYNLAIAFDQLGYRDQALEHYQAALQLARLQKPLFTTQQVQDRIRELTTLTD